MLVVAWLMLMFGVAPPVELIGVVAVTDVTVPVVGVVHVGAPAPLDVNTCPDVPIGVTAKADVDEP